MVKKESTILMLLEITIEALKQTSIFLKGVEYNEYIGDKKTKYACERAAEKVGDSLKEILNRLEKENFKITEEIRDVFLNAYGFRNKLSHGYDNLNDEIVYFVLNNDFKSLNKTINEFKELNDV